MHSAIDRESKISTSRSRQKPLALLAATALVALFAVGCAQQAAAPAGAGGAGQETPKRGGVLDMAVNIAEPAHIDPIRSSLGPLVLNGKLYSGLLQFDPIDNTKIIGELAERWEVSPDGKTYTFYLHKNVKWHDGVPFSAEDVKYTYDRMRDPNDRQAADLNSTRELFRPVKNIEAPNATTLRINLSQPSNSMLGTLALGTVMIVPKHVEGTSIDLSKDVLGTGAFKLKNYQRGAVIQVERNPDYFIQDRPYLDGINTYLLKDLTTRIAAFSTGQIKLLAEIYKTEVDQIKKDVPQAVVSTKTALRPGFLQFHNEKPPFNDVRVRRAIHLAFDRQAALDVLVPGEGTLGTLLPPELSEFTQEELSKLPGYRANKTQDMAEAKRLLAEAGYPNGFTTTVGTSGNSPDYEALAVFTKDQLKKIGIDVTVNITQPSVGSSNLQLGTYETQAVVAVLRYLDPISGGYKYDKGNDVRFEDARFQDLLHRQDAVASAVERKKLIRQMEERWLELSPYVVLYWKSHSAVVYPEVRGFEIGVGIYNFLRFTDVWLAN